jgi:erythromycin esterase-like protein
MLFMLLTLLPARSQAQAPSLNASLEAALRQHRFSLQMKDGALSGSGLSLLEEGIHDARYVLIGEDHVTREIPLFAAAVCDIMAPQRLSAMAVEAGPLAANFVSSLFGKPDRFAEMAAHIGK